jgi:hypothetical protein
MYERGGSRGKDTARRSALDVGAGHGATDDTRRSADTNEARDALLGGEDDVEGSRVRAPAFDLVA